MIGDYVTNTDEPSFHTNDWSFEAWINPSDIGDASQVPILFIGDGDGLGSYENQDELQIGIRNGYLELCYDTAQIQKIKNTSIVKAQFNTSLAVSHDTDGNGLKNGISVFI